MMQCDFKGERVFSDPAAEPESESARGEHVQDPGPDRDPVHHLPEHQAHPRHGRGVQLLSWRSVS